MANIDLHDLRMQEFPHNVRLALNKLEVCLQASPSPQMVLLQQRIVDEFIFSSYSVSKHKSNPIKVLSHSVNELTLVSLLLEHLSNCSSAAVCNSLLLVLFHPSSLDPAQQHSNNNPYKNTGNNVPNNPYARPPPNMFGGGNHNNPYARGSSQQTVHGNMPSHNPYNTGGQLGKHGTNNAETANRVSQRLNILASLTSMAVATRNIEAMHGIASWMQQVCCLSGWCGQVCKRLIAEYCTPASSLIPINDGNNAATTDADITSHPLQQLPNISALFTANLITSWAQLYARLAVSTGSDTSCSGYTCRRPPLPLLRLMVSWLQVAPASLLLTPLTAPPPSLHSHTTSQPATAIAPLLRWCVEAPFFLQSASSVNHGLNPAKSTSSDHKFATSPNKKFKSESHKGELSMSNLNCSVITIDEESNDGDDPFGKKRNNHGSELGSEEEQLYASLLVCLLRTLHAAPYTLQNTQHAQVLCCDQLLGITEGLLTLLEPPSTPTGDSPQLEARVEAVDRLVQVVLVANKTSCLSGSKAELWTALRRLPMYNRLVNILLTSPHQ